MRTAHEHKLPFGQSSDKSGKITFPKYKFPFMDHEEGDGVFINPRSN